MARKQYGGKARCSLRHSAVFIDAIGVYKHGPVNHSMCHLSEPLLCHLSAYQGRPCSLAAEDDVCDRLLLISTVKEGLDLQQPQPAIGIENT